MNSVLQISRVTLEERCSIDCKGLSCNQFVFSLSAQNKKQLSIFILTFRPSILVSLPFGSYFTTHDTYGIFLPRPAPVANYSRKVCFINLWYVWCLMVFIIGIRHFFIVLILVLGFPVNWRGFSLTSSEILQSDWKKWPRVDAKLSM